MLEDCGPVSAIIHEPDAVRVLIQPTGAGAEVRVFSALAQASIAIDAVARSWDSAGAHSWEFTAERAELGRLRQVMGALGIRCHIDPAVSKLSLVGSGLLSHPEATGQMLAALAGSGIRAYSLAMSQTRTVVIVTASDGPRAVRVLHRKLGAAMA